MEKIAVDLLLIEDNPLDARMFQLLIGKVKNLDVRLHAAGTLAEGLEYARRKDFRLVLLDLNLPDGNGLDTFFMFQEKGPDLAIVVLTSLEDQEMARRALRAGAQDYLLKGKIDPIGLEKTIIYSLERKQGERELRHTTVRLHATIEKLKKEVRQRRQAEVELKKMQARLNEQVDEKTKELQETIERLSIQLKERQMMSEALHESEEQFRSLVASLPGAVYRCRIDEDFTLEFISEKIEEITGYPPSFFIRNRVKSYRSIIHPDDRRKVLQAVEQGLDPMASIHAEYRIIDASNNIRWFIEKGRAIFSEHGEPLWLDGAIFDDSERKFAEEALHKANQELKRLAILDGLTQIPNRRRFDEHLNKEWNRMQRDQSRLSLILSDIDFFKRYNDHYGHQEGDACLQAVARTIYQVAMRPADLAARYGGEEFAVILPDTDLEGAVHVAQKVRREILKLKIPHAYSDADSYVSLSLGVACVTPKKGVAVAELLLAADSALYKAKENGRNCVYPESSG